MTGLDCMREELLKRGYSKAQAESKVVTGVLEIVAQDASYRDIERLTKDKKELEALITGKEKRLRDLQYTEQIMRERLSSAADAFNKQTREYMETFQAALRECETPEGRDAMRIAQMFINSVDVDTKYDNTAYIIGLASILSNWKTGAIDQLRKINTRIPEVKVFQDGGVRITEASE